MHLFVTGATGFVGNVLLDLLPGRVGWEKITCFVLPNDPGRAHLLRKGLGNIEIVEGDVRNPREVEDAIKGHTHVIHLAGLISYWRKERDKLVQVNRQGVENVVNACLHNQVKKLIHVSSVGAIGFFRDGRLADENTAFNWPDDFFYMTTKFAGQRIVEDAVRQRGLKAVILNPASLMGPGDADSSTAHNQLIGTIYSRTLWGCFAGGLAITDVRDLAGIIIKALHGATVGEKYLVVGANVEYTEVVKAIGRCFNRKVFPFRVPPFLLAAAGGAMEIACGITNQRPPLTWSYGRLSGWYGYYSNRKSLEAFQHEYLPFEQTIADDCRYFEDVICGNG